MAFKKANSCSCSNIQVDINSLDDLSIYKSCNPTDSFDNNTYQTKCHQSHLPFSNLSDDELSLLILNNHKYASTNQAENTIVMLTHLHYMINI